MNKPILFLWIGVAGVAVAPSFAQTQVDLRTQSKQVDFSAAPYTKPFKTGTSLPATCTVGEAYFKTDAPAGQNLYGCTATNTWTLQSGGVMTSGGGGSSTPNYGVYFSVQTTVRVPGTTHRFGTSNLLVSCYDADTPSRVVEPDSVTVDKTTFDITINFVVPQSGSCAINGTGDNQLADPAAGNGITVSTLDVARSMTSTLTIGAECTQTAPCNVRFGSTVYGFTGSATATLTGGTGTAWVYVARDGSLVVGHTMSLTCTGCRAQGSTTAFPTDAVPLYTWTATNGVWDEAGGTDRRAFLSTKAVVAGPGVIAADSGTATTISLDTALVPMFLTGTAALDIPSIAAGACASDLALSLPGAMPGDAVAAGWPAALPTGLVGTMRVTSTDLVAVRLCNPSAGIIDPPPAVYRATVVRGF